MSLKGRINELGGAVPLKKYHLESSGEKAAASTAGGSSGQRWRRGSGPLTSPSADTVQNTLPRNTSTVSFWAGSTQKRDRLILFCSGLRQCDVSGCFPCTIFDLDLTYGDSIKHTLAVQRLPCNLILVVKLAELPLPQRGVQNLPQQPHGAIPQWFTWGP